MSKTIAYMGNKRKLVPTLRALMCQEWPDLAACHLVDAFFGAGGFALGVHDAFKSITLNDYELYSVLIATAAFSIAPPTPSIVMVDCNMEDGYITHQYCQDRKFFTAENGRIIDSFRDATRLLLTDPTQQAIAMGNLISAADAVANTTGVYGAYLKQYKRSSLKPLTCVPHIGIWTSEADAKPVTITHGDATTACLAAPPGANCSEKSTKLAHQSACPLLAPPLGRSLCKHALWSQAAILPRAACTEYIWLFGFLSKDVAPS